MITYHLVVATVVQNVPVLAVGDAPASWEVFEVVDFNKLMQQRAAAKGVIPAAKPVVGAPQNAKTPVANPSGTDVLARLYKADGAEVRVGLEERRSGPVGSFSSVTLSIQVSSRCAAETAALHKLQEVLYAECTRMLEAHAEPAMRLLIEHLEGA